jgi:hypothetical protein
MCEISCSTVYRRDGVCVRCRIVNRLHTGDDRDKNNTISIGPLLPPHRAQQLYRKESLHQPRHPVTAAVFRITIKDTSCRWSLRESMLQLLIILYINGTKPVWILWMNVSTEFKFLHWISDGRWQGRAMCMADETDLTHLFLCDVKLQLHETGDFVLYMEEAKCPDWASNKKV